MMATPIAPPDSVSSRRSCVMCGEDLGHEGVLVEFQGTVLAFRSLACLRRFLMEPDAIRSGRIGDLSDGHGPCWPPSEWCL